MKKKYIRPETELVNAWAQCNTDLFASNAIVTTANGDETESSRITEYTGGWEFVVGAKQHIWDEEDSQWND